MPGEPSEVGLTELVTTSQTTKSVLKFETPFSRDWPAVEITAFQRSTIS